MAGRSEPRERHTRPFLTSSSPSPTISTHTIHTHSEPSLVLDVAAVLLLLLALWSGGWWTWLGAAGGVLWTRAKMGAVLDETVLAVSGLGLQLSTTRGLHMRLPFTSMPCKVPLSTSRLFLPLSSISDVVINEGIYGWKIIYYLIVIQHDGNSSIKLCVGFPELLPRLDELRQIWQGVRCTLFDELGPENDDNWR